MADVSEAASSAAEAAVPAAALVDENGQPISKSEYKRRLKLAEKEKEKAAKAAAKAAEPNSGAAKSGAGTRDDDIEPSK